MQWAAQGAAAAALAVGTVLHPCACLECCLLGISSGLVFHILTVLGVPSLWRTLVRLTAELWHWGILEVDHLLLNPFCGESHLFIQLIAFWDLAKSFSILQCAGCPVGYGGAEAQHCSQLLAAPGCLGKVNLRSDASMQHPSFSFCFSPSQHKEPSISSPANSCCSKSYIMGNRPQ